MLSRFTTGAEHLYIAVGATDFRKQSNSLVTLVQGQFGMDPFTEDSVFLFCNKRRNAIRVLRYDKTGFVLASKKLLERMKFQWPRDSSEVREISYQQVEWLLQGLEIEQKKAHHEVRMNAEKTCY